MKIMTLILFIFMGLNANAFTLSESQGRYFNNNEIDIFISPTDCSGAGFETSRLTTLVKNAVEDYWNAVPSSALFLDVRGIHPDMSLEGRDHNNAINNIVPNNAIVAGCNDDITDFSNPAILGSAVLSCSGSICKAVLILNANNSNLQTKSESEIEAVIAHELGHAFGLGHTEIQHNLMYYSTSGKTQKWLGQDDIDGVTYLYPHEPELMGLLGSCGTINIDNDLSGPGNFMFQLMLGLLFILLMAMLLKRYKNFKY